MCVVLCVLLVAVLVINAIVYQRSHYIRLEHDKMREVRKVAKLVKASRAVLENKETPKPKIEPQKLELKNTTIFIKTNWNEPERTGTKSDEL